jgi:hypothetical protein
LCNKPNCKHQEEEDDQKRQECNAYTTGRPSNLSYANDTLYACFNSYRELDDEWNPSGAPPAVVKFDSNGSGKQVVFRPEQYMGSVFFDDGYIYYAYTKLDQANPEEEYGIMRYDLRNVNGKAEPMQVFEGDARNYLLLCDDEYLYSCFIRLSTGDKETLQIGKSTLKTSDIDFSAAFYINAYYNDPNFKGLQFSKQSLDDFIKTSKLGELKSEHPLYRIASNEQYIAVETAETYENEQYIMILDKNYNEVNRINIPRRGASAILGMDNQNLFFTEANDENPGGWDYKMIAVADLGNKDVKGEVFFAHP